MTLEELTARLKEIKKAQQKEPTETAERSSDVFVSPVLSTSTETEFEDVSPSSDPVDLDIDEDGTIYGDKPILKTAEERAATKPDEYGWRDPWKQRVRTTRR